MINAVVMGKNNNLNVSDSSNNCQYESKTIDRGDVVAYSYQGKEKKGLLLHIDNYQVTVVPINHTYYGTEEQLQRDFKVLKVSKEDGFDGEGYAIFKFATLLKKEEIRKVSTLNENSKKKFFTQAWKNLKRGDVVTYTVGDEIQYALVIQNDIGNRFSPTVIVANITFSPSKESIFLSKGEGGLLQNGYLSLVEIQTIDKSRVQSKLTKISSLSIEKLNAHLTKEYDMLNVQKMNVQKDRFQKGEIVKVNAGNNVIGREQGGVRPALILKTITNDKGEEKYVVSYFTSKMTKADIDTHVFFGKNEGGLQRDSIIMAEQIAFIEKKQILESYGFQPKEKSKYIDGAVKLSIGLSM